MRKKVFVGLSGGVDSAVSAALLQKEGYEVIGLFAWIAVSSYPCTASEDRRDALRTAAHLQIQFEEIDLSKEYQQTVFEDAIASYALGETPNPDAVCNREIKFGLLYDYAMKQGADFFATGHYARMQNVGNETHLRIGVDRSKDQSYFLWAVKEERLAKTFFPVGGINKSEVRKLAQVFGLPNAARKDSQGLCFLGNISIEDALVKELQPYSGAVLNERGAAIGVHSGAALYTIGQRHGFELRLATENTEPHYVIGKNIESNTITVAPRSAPGVETEMITRVSLRETNWIGGSTGGTCMARFRYRQPLVEAQLRSNIEVLMRGQFHIPIGQSLVLYKEERCLGGGIIDRVA